MTLMNTFDATEATPVSPYDSDFIPFQIIANSIHDVFNNAILTPGVMVRRFSVSASMCRTLLHFVAFFHIASLFSGGADNKKVGVDNEKALELINSTVLSFP